jgi:ketosteroid isomerase-like protein
VSGVAASVECMDTNPNGHAASVKSFFDDYAAALLARDARAVAGMYAVPSLILFPGQSIAVDDAGQTEKFFASAWGQYDGVDSIERQLEVVAEAPGSRWADVTWLHDGEPRERFIYQLVGTDDAWQIAVLTPMG